VKFNVLDIQKSLLQKTFENKIFFPDLRILQLFWYSPTYVSWSKSSNWYL